VSTLVSIAARFLREFFSPRRIPTLAQALNRSFRQARVNILKKVRIAGRWKLCPAVIEAGGKLKDRVRVGARLESHPEGSYYLDWRENGAKPFPSAATCASARV